MSKICRDLVSWVKKKSRPKKLSLLIFSDENNIAKLVLDMWQNCFNRLCQLLNNWIPNEHHSQMFYKLGVLKNFAKFTWIHQRETPAQVFLANFAKFLRTPFLQNTSGQMFLDFFMFYCFFVIQWTNRNQAFSIFEHVLSQVSNKMNITNFAIGKLYFAIY